MSKGILVVAEDRSFGRDVWPLLEREGYEITIVSNTKEAMEKLESRQFDLLLTEITVYGLEESGLLRGVERLNPDMEVVIVSSDREGPLVVYPIKTETVVCLQEPMDVRTLLSTMYKRSDDRQTAQASSISSVTSRRSRFFPASSPKAKECCRSLN